MCGIYGMVSLNQPPLRFPHLARCMPAALRHRGPDSHGLWSTQSAIVGATRLRIIDRRETGDQPFVAPDGTVVVCNGEIYNAGDIRSRFPTYPYRSTTDVEPIVPLITRHGAAGFHALDGMFAIATWNENTRTLRLARDRAGEKPLFYCRMQDEIWFASEIQALRIHPDALGDINAAAVGDYLAHGYVREPQTLHTNVRKVAAGTVMEFSGDEIRTHALDYETGECASDRKSPHRLRSLLRTAVGKQLAADVPVGVFLSGGLDSSLVTAYATESRPGMHSFTTRFQDASYDEGIFARRVAAHFRTRHHEVHMSPRKLEEALRIVSVGIAEPIADPAILPTVLLARTAREHVGVVLSGEGSDELFGGYPTYLGHQFATMASNMPGWTRTLVRAALSRGAASTKRVPAMMMADELLAHAGEDLVRRHLSWFGTGLLQYLPIPLQSNILSTYSPTAQSTDPVLTAMSADFSGYLRDKLLPKLDRASMLSSLETRAPFLDRHVVRYARSLPRQQLATRTKLKVALVESARGVLPDWVVRRRKRGLSVPIARWLNEELAPTVDGLLDPIRIANQPCIPDLPVGRLLGEHRRGVANHSRALWPLIVLQLWLEHWEGVRSNDPR